MKVRLSYSVEKLVAEIAVVAIYYRGCILSSGFAGFIAGDGLLLAAVCRTQAVARPTITIAWSRVVGHLRGQATAVLRQWLYLPKRLHGLGLGEGMVISDYRP